MSGVPDRRADERLLQMVGLRAEGWSGAQVAEALGIQRATVFKRTNAVLAADLAESGESRFAVRRAYWKGITV